MTYFIDLRASSRGGSPVLEVHDVMSRIGGDIVDTSTLLDNVRGMDVLLGTHGFNVNLADGISSLSAWEPKLTLGGSSQFIGVLWPGDSSWLPVLDYPVEGGEAERSGDLLAKFLDKNFGEAASISFASHSLGARMVLQTIKRMARNVKRLVLMAGAINEDCLTAAFKEAAANVEKISVLASREDYVLKLAFPVGNLIDSIFPHGHPYRHTAIGYTGPSPVPQDGKVQAGWQIPDNWKYGHHSYLDKIAGGPMTLPVTLQTPPPPPPPGDTSAWSAGFVSTRIT